MTTPKTKPIQAAPTKPFNQARMEPSHFEQLYPEDTRKKEIKKVLEYVSSGKSCQVIGFPGVGKSTLLRLLPYNRQVRELHLGAREPKYHFVYMDFSEVRARSLADIIKFMLITLVYSLSERKLLNEYETLNKILKEGLELSDELILFQSLKKGIDFLANERELSVIFLVDRFEEYVPNIDSQFFLNLKILRNRAKYRFAAVFGITRPIEDVLEPNIFAEFSEFLLGNTVFLPIYDKAGLRFRFKHLEDISGKPGDSKTKVEIIRLSGGHGKLARICYEACLADSPLRREASESRRTVLATNDERRTTNFLEEFLLSKNQVKGALSEIWNFLTPEEKKDLKEEKGNESLEKIGLFANGKLTIPLFESFAKTLTPQTSLKLIYDPARNEIIKGAENLTEKLSPSEFRLLRFLLENRGRVCEKDEIIQNIWSDTKTIAGVSDQALDQIIYRLRKKIEDDPETPRFIQTIKGRGYKLA